VACLSRAPLQVSLGERPSSLGELSASKHAASAAQHQH
ncbi:hypothetical protein A2U01_0100978, partial [Trifolium medium]|nr:hypothetical protein [Trifolium medium]